MKWTKLLYVWELSSVYVRPEEELSNAFRASLYESHVSIDNLNDNICISLTVLFPSALSSLVD